MTKKIYFLPGGLTVVFDGEAQVPELEVPWIENGSLTPPQRSSPECSTPTGHSIDGASKQPRLLKFQPALNLD
jgi:hypothetical protein